MSAWNPPWAYRPITGWIERPVRHGPRGLWTLIVKWADSPYRVEVRGVYDVPGADSDFQRIIDRLPGPLVGGELFAGNTAHVNGRMYAAAWPVLAEILGN